MIYVDWYDACYCNDCASAVGPGVASASIAPSVGMRDAGASGVPGRPAAQFLQDAAPGTKIAKAKGVPGGFSTKLARILQCNPQIFSKFPRN